MGEDRDAIGAQTPGAGEMKSVEMPQNDLDTPASVLSAAAFSAANTPFLYISASWLSYGIKFSEGSSHGREGHPA